MSDETVRHFGFTQFRFVVAGILLLAAGLKAWQLATTPLPPVVQGSMFTPLLELFNNRYLLMAVVVGEILFALILIAGIWKQWTWLLSILAFTAFTMVSSMKGLIGESSCGCFGTVTINPWITTCLDLIIVALLVVFRERFQWTFPPLDRKRVWVVLVMWLLLAGSALFFMLSLKEQPQTILGTSFAGLDGKQMVLLEPNDWIGKEFPLFAHFVKPNDSEMLRRGTWNVLLIHTDCPDCRQMMTDLEKQNAENVAIVVVPSQPNEKVPDTNFPVFVLDDQNDWFTETPCVVKMNKGICIGTDKEPLQVQCMFITFIHP